MGFVPLTGTERLLSISIADNLFFAQTRTMANDVLLFAFACDANSGRTFTRALRWP